MGYEGQSVFSNGRIQFANGVFNSCRSGVVGSRRGVLGSGVMCRDSSRGHQPFHCTQPHCIPSAGHPQSGYYLYRNKFNSCVGRVRENQRNSGDRGNHGDREISGRCVDRENRSFLNGAVGTVQTVAVFSIDTKIIIFNFAMLPINLEIIVLDFVSPEIMILDLCVSRL